MLVRAEAARGQLCWCCRCLAGVLQVQEGAELLSERTETEDKKLNKVGLILSANNISNKQAACPSMIACLWRSQPRVNVNELFCCC
jgi:hypothetical protein